MAAVMVLVTAEKLRRLLVCLFGWLVWLAVVGKHSYVLLLGLRDLAVPC